MGRHDQIYHLRKTLLFPHILLGRRSLDSRRTTIRRSPDDHGIESMFTDFCCCRLFWIHGIKKLFNWSPSSKKSKSDFLLTVCSENWRAHFQTMGTDVSEIPFHETTISVSSITPDQRPPLQSMGNYRRKLMSISKSLRSAQFYSHIWPRRFRMHFYSV